MVVAVNLPKITAIYPARGRMTDGIRITKHETVPKTGSFEVNSRTAGNQSSSTGTTARAGACGPNMLTSDQALEQAKAFASAERDKS
jgi:hypothetical protein